MSIAPSEATAETIPGDPSHREFLAAEQELERLASRGAGQPYLLAIKLCGETRILHLRAYLENPNDNYAWADLRHTPQEIQSLALGTTQEKALKWQTFGSGGILPSPAVNHAVSLLISADNDSPVLDSLHPDTGRSLAAYLRLPAYGLFFEPNRNHDAWVIAPNLHEKVEASVEAYLRILDAHFPPVTDSDAAAEMLPVDPAEVESYREQIANGSFEVQDTTTTVKTRGSAQKAFAQMVKQNYNFQCAVTGIKNKEFLVAAHIVPWSVDPSIRLDPSNGICLSLIIDRAFETGYLLIEDDFSIRIDWTKVRDDIALKSQLEPYEGQKITLPATCAPAQEHLRRRRALVN